MQLKNLLNKLLRKKDTDINKLIAAHAVSRVKRQAALEAQRREPCSADSFLSLKHIQKVYPNGYHAVIDFNLEVKEGEFIVFVGPSGCGKSTTLRMICGLEEISAGSLYINQVYSNLLSPSERGIAMVFQNYALFPHLSVYENIAYGLKIRKIKAPLLDKDGQQKVGIDERAIKELEREKKWILANDPDNIEDIENIDHDINEYRTHEIPLFTYRKLTKQEIADKIAVAADVLNLKELLQRKPAQLSGGQCQRVALGRVIVSDAKLLLMDEPLSNLDAKLRDSMRGEIIALHKRIGATTVYVTHDQVEAMTMADRIVVMNKAVVMQIGTPKEVYDHPNSLFVATFIGSPNMNIVKAEYKNDKLYIGDTAVYADKKLSERLDEFYKEQIELLGRECEQELADVQSEALAEHIKSEYRTRIEKLRSVVDSKQYPLKLGIRPENITSGVKDAIRGEVISAELLGNEYHVKIKLGDDSVIFKLPPDAEINAGDEVGIGFQTGKLHLFDEITQKALF